MAKVLTADLLFDSADHAMQTLGAAAWDEREGMIDLFLDARAARSAPISQELATQLHRAARAGPTRPPLSARPREKEDEWRNVLGRISRSASGR